MKVIITIRTKDQECCWEDMSIEEQQQLRRELNQQTANKLGYQMTS